MGQNQSDWERAEPALATTFCYLRHISGDEGHFVPVQICKGVSSKGRGLHPDHAASSVHI